MLDVDDILQAQTIFGFGGVQSNGACQGGNGAPGGDGGASGGGAGGISAAVLYNGSKPALSKTSTAHGTAGARGTGGNPGHNDGVVGKNGDLIEAP